ncbi:hypothetical protein OJJOAM_000308 [Cupriavidus sp. H18C1]
MAATSIMKPSREVPPATANGIDDTSAMLLARPERSRCARTLGR